MLDSVARRAPRSCLTRRVTHARRGAPSIQLLCRFTRSHCFTHALIRSSRRCFIEPLLFLSPGYLNCPRLPLPSTHPSAPPPFSSSQKAKANTQQREDDAVQRADVPPVAHHAEDAVPRLRRR